MKKIVFALALMATVVSCNNNQETDTPENNAASSPMSNEVPGGEDEDINIEELAKQPLSKDAKKYKGQYQLKDDNGIKTLIREHPEKPGLLAVTTSVGNREPLTVAYWYNEEEDMLSSKQVKGQPKFTTIKLDPSGQTMLHIRHDWNRNRTDTTVYKRIE